MYCWGVCHNPNVEVGETVTFQVWMAGSLPRGLPDGTAGSFRADPGTPVTVHVVPLENVAVVGPATATINVPAPTGRTRRSFGARLLHPGVGVVGFRIVPAPLPH